MRILFFYSVYQNIAETYWDYINAFSKHSKHKIDFYPVNVPEPIDLSKYDVIIMHYGLCLYNKQIPLNQMLQDAIRAFKGLKVYIAQDEYTTPENAAKRLQYMGVHHVFSCVSDDMTFEKIYPKSQLPNLTYDTVLPGYAPDYLLDISDIALGERPYDIVYRGNSLGHMFGSLGAEKFQIGMEMQRYAEKYELSCDIDYRSNKKIFGDDWIKFLQSGRAMLCTESGSSIVHEDDKARDVLKETVLICEHVDDWDMYMAYTKDYAKYWKDDGKYTVSCISSKAFEAIAAGTVLVCFEGKYSDAIIPGVHYIALKKDFSNIADVVEKIKDTEYLDKMRKRAYQDIIASKKYSYKAFIDFVDERLEKKFNEMGFALVAQDNEDGNSMQLIRKLHFEPLSFSKNPTLYIKNIIVSNIFWAIAGFKKMIRPIYNKLKFLILYKLRLKAILRWKNDE